MTGERYTSIQSLLECKLCTDVAHMICDYVRFCEEYERNKEHFTTLTLPQIPSFMFDIRRNLRAHIVTSNLKNMTNAFHFVQGRRNRIMYLQHIFDYLTDNIWWFNQPLRYQVRNNFFRTVIGKLVELEKDGLPNVNTYILKIEQ